MAERLTLQDILCHTESDFPAIVKRLKGMPKDEAARLKKELDAFLERIKNKKTTPEDQKMAKKMAANIWGIG